MGTKLVEMYITFLQRIDLTLVRWRSIINKKIDSLKEEQRTIEE